MISERILREIVALLESHDFRESLDLIENGNGDFDSVLRVLLRSYNETCDEKFFLCFYRLTCLFVQRRLADTLQENNLSLNPEILIAEVYRVILRTVEDNGLSERYRILQVCAAAASQVVYLRSDLDSEKKTSLLVKSVCVEDERRISLLSSRIHEALLGGGVSLTSKEVIILTHIFSDGMSLDDVAKQLRTSIEEIRETLYKVKRNTQSILMLSSEIEKRES